MYETVIGSWPEKDDRTKDCLWHISMWQMYTEIKKFNGNNSSIGSELAK